MDYYQIKDWAKHYENNRTKDLVRMTWIPVPNKHDGDGLTALLDVPKVGAAHFGAWNMIIQVASKCHPRGLLVRESGLPHDSTSLSRITRLPKELYDEVIPRLIDKEIGWLEVVSHEPAEILQSSANFCQKLPMEWNGMEWNGMESKPIGHLPRGEIDKMFKMFWDNYPKRLAKEQARRTFDKLVSKQIITQDSMPLLLKAVSQAKSSEQWQKDNGQFIPYPSTWLNQHRWEDDVSAIQGVSVGLTGWRAEAEARLKAREAISDTARV